MCYVCRLSPSIIWLLALNMTMQARISKELFPNRVDKPASEEHRACAAPSDPDLSSRVAYHALDVDRPHRVGGASYPLHSAAHSSKTKAADLAESTPDRCRPSTAEAMSDSPRHAHARQQRLKVWKKRHDRGEMKKTKLTTIMMISMLRDLFEHTLSQHL